VLLVILSLPTARVQPRWRRLLPPKPLQEHWRKSFVIDERDRLTEYSDE
jgi:hypothetical protein